MKVSELINELKKCNPDDLVIMSKDAEGNSYSPLYDLDLECAYEAESSWWGEVRLRDLTQEHIDQGYEEEDVASDDAVPCVILRPIN